MNNSIRMRYIILSVFLFGSYLGKAQTNLNDYKYIVVPKKFDGFKKENQYETSTLIKYLFSQKGYITVWADNLPEELSTNTCSALFVALDNKSSMFKTKTTIILNDCNRQQIFSTLAGSSKQKDFKKSYNEALTQAMKSFDKLQHEYNGKSDTTESITVSFKNDVKKVDENKKTMAQSKNVQNKAVIQETTTERQTYKNIEPKPSEYKKAEEAIIVIEQKATREEQRFKTIEPVASDIKKAEPTFAEVSDSPNSSEKTKVLYAQALNNGYQLVDSTPKIQLKIRKTTLIDYYLAEGNGKNGVVFKKSGKWYFEYYLKDQLKVDELNIKF